MLARSRKDLRLLPEAVGGGQVHVPRLHDVVKEDRVVVVDGPVKDLKGFAVSQIRHAADDVSAVAGKEVDPVSAFKLQYDILAVGASSS